MDVVNGSRRRRRSAAELAPLRARALELRLAGRSYREIAAELPVAKSTLSDWLADVPLTAEHQARLEELQASGRHDRAVAGRAARVRRTEVVHEAAAAEVGVVTDRDLFVAGLVAYWCEGSKAKPWRPSESVAFINSDPDLISLFVRWLRSIGVPDTELVFRLAIHASADVDGAGRFWRTLVGGADEQWRRPTLKSHRTSATVRRNTGEGYVGCLVVRVRRSVELNRRIAGWWSAIARNGADPTMGGERSALV